MVDVYIEGKSLGLNPSYGFASSYAKHTVDLTSLDENSWYPYSVNIFDEGVDTSKSLANEMRLISGHVTLTADGSSGTPYYGTYNNHGTFATMTVLVVNNSWGIRPDSSGYLLDDAVTGVSDNKRLMSMTFGNNNNGYIFYLRGGVKYVFTFNVDLVGTLYPTGINKNGEKFEVLSDAPQNSHFLIDLKSHLGGVKLRYRLYYATPVKEVA